MHGTTLAFGVREWMHEETEGQRYTLHSPLNSTSCAVLDAQRCQHVERIHL